MDRQPLTYAQAGVDVEAGDRAVALMRSAVEATHGPKVLGGIGGFAGLWRLAGDLGRAGVPTDPVLAAASDGVGTKLLVAQALDRHDTVGIDLVAISNQEKALALAKTPLELPADVPEWLSPLVSIVPAQLFCYHLTRAMGRDTEAPQGLSKVTRTW